MVSSFGRRELPPEPDPELDGPVLPHIPVVLMPTLDAREMERIALQIQRAVYEAVRAGFQQATQELAGEEEDPDVLHQT